MVSTVLFVCAPISLYHFFPIIFMIICCRLINPIVVAPTVAAVGLAFFSYGFPQAGSCVEISIPQILLVLIFTLVSDYLVLNVPMQPVLYLNCCLKEVVHILAS